MYDYFGLILVGLITLMGLFMFLFPKMSARKDQRDDEYQVNKIKKNGLILSVVGVIALVFLAYYYFNIK